jgi:hypothetical protein
MVSQKTGSHANIDHSKNFVQKNRLETNAAFEVRIRNVSANLVMNRLLEVSHNLKCIDQFRILDKNKNDK